MLKINSVTKLYSEKKGIKDFELRSDGGEIISVIGPNGAGKTTLLKIISGLMVPDSGDVCLEGDNTADRICKSRIGYSPSLENIYQKLLVGDLIDMVSEVKFNGEFRKEALMFMELFEISEYINYPLKDCSYGTKKKVEIVISFMGNPKLIILDEPTNGVDARGILILKDLVKKNKENGRCIVVASHVLDFVKAVSDRNIFIKEGAIVKEVENSGDLEEEYRLIYNYKKVLE